MEEEEEGYITIKNIKTCIDNPLFNHFQYIRNIKGLISLYQSSQIECSRANGLTPEVGSSRERDIIASLVNNPSLEVNYSIHNQNHEDVIVNKKKISIKHSSNKYNNGNGIKIIWTVNKEKRDEFIEKFYFTCDLMIIYVRFLGMIHQGELEIIYIPKEVLLHQQCAFLIAKQPVFKCLEGNNRGVELDKKFFEKIILYCLFRIKISFRNIITEYTNPINKRLKLLN